MALRTKRSVWRLLFRSAFSLGFLWLAAITLHRLSFGSPPTHVRVFSVVDMSVLQQPQQHQYRNGYHPWNSAPEEHTYTPDGLLIVNPNGPHPIFELIRNAENEWNAKLQRASKTLEEAVVEYERRYKRPPPLGFDKWWDYVVKHDVLLPDEYDEIYYDLEPYWGLHPEDLAASERELEERDDIIVVAKTPESDKLEIVRTTVKGNPTAFLVRISDILNLLEEVEHDLPPLRMSFSPHDNPNMLSDWRIKSMVMNAAKRGTTVRQKDFPPIHTVGWAQGCQPSTPARVKRPPLPALPPHAYEPQFNTSAPKTFIASHRATMDPCAHPSLLVTHGQFLSHYAGPYPQKTLVPRFSLCATQLHHDIRPPVPYGWVSGLDLEEHGDVPWEEKIDERLDWRGSNTGLYASSNTPWSYAQRARLVSLANSVIGNVSILPVPEDENTKVGEPEEVRLARVNPAWMDVAFVGGAIMCDEKGGTCKEMEKMWEFRRSQGRKEEGRYKFILDVDGNGWSGRFKRLMTTNSLIFKATIYPEWYTSRIAPWVHYVPIQVSYTDLYDAVAFFRTHDDLAKRIASEGRAWSMRFWRKEDMSAYLYRLFLEYARVSSMDRDAMSYKGSSTVGEEDL
ncbi:glycosyltransferase family 90 protein [Pisolithus tinctorius]|uniref:Glycosyltransferase family 90 protein n=1 Tax=Pisolithus tinctorius Marx 270 TaxID=870435 RepID=A0A0C3JUA3_PISTI|nr:glycosyltransferase family 90 protein [Pisolithus tinctorius]KIO01037.1 glycosyltransferase family 90 protein [Pisolithus tinctorius Marx 270]